MRLSQSRTKPLQFAIIDVPADDAMIYESAGRLAAPAAIQSTRVEIYYKREN